MEATNYEELGKKELVNLLALRDRSLQEKEDSLRSKEHEIDQLRHYLNQANKRIFGRKSEKLSLDEKQTSLFSFELPEPGPIPETVEVPAHSRKRSGRKPLPSDLPRERVDCPLENTTCACCGKELKRIGEEITEELDIVPAHMVIREYVRGKYACSSCKNAVQTAPLPPSVQPLERSRPGIGLLVFIILSKFVDHIPLYRLEKIFLRMGIQVSRQRMSDWLAAVVPKMILLYECLLGQMLKVNYLQGDETEIKVQDPDVEGKLFKGYFWGAHAPDLKLAAFRYFASRAGIAAKEMFKGFEGTLQTDDYAGYNAVMLPEKVLRVACMAHIRRKFIDATKSSPTECNHVVALIAKLYQIEKAAKDYEPDKRKALRQKNAPPILDAIEKYLKAMQLAKLPKAPVQEAVNYALSQWPKMLRYLDDGRFHIDNNAMEREIRPIAIGRKNYLFAGSHQAAQRAAMLYSFIASCRLNKVNPAAWFIDVLKRLPKTGPAELHTLLPHLWKPMPQA